MDLLESPSYLESPSTEHAIFNMLKGALEYPASTEARATKIARDIVFCCDEMDKETHASYTLTYTWIAMFRLATRIPAGHECQKCLVQALAILRAREGSTRDGERVC
jgi:hypothetical protein